MEETNDMQTLLAQETLALEEARRVTQLAQTNKAQHDAFEQWVADQTTELPQTSSDVSKPALRLGLLLASSGKPQEAVEWLGKASPGMEKSLALGLCLLQTRQFDQAVLELDRAHIAGADEFTIAMCKVEALRQAGKLDEAQQLLKQYSGSEPKGPPEPVNLVSRTKADYWYQLGRICEDQDERDQAFEHYQKCLQIQEDHQGAHFRMGYYSDLAGDDEAALEHYRQCTNTWPVHVNALLNLAVLYEDAEQYDKAEVCLRKILSANPNHARARLYLRDVVSTKTMYYDEEQERRQDRRNQVLETPVTDFELSVRSRNCLKAMGLTNLGDLLNVTEHDLLNYKNFGETSLLEIKAMLAQKGLTLGQFVKDRDIKTGLLPQEDSQEEQTDADVAMNLLLSEVTMSMRVRRCLEQLGAVTLGEVCEMSEEELLVRKNFGQTSLDEIKVLLAEHGLTFSVGPEQLEQPEQPEQSEDPVQ